MASIAYEDSARSTNPETVLSTGLNSLSNGSAAQSSAVANSDLDTMCDAFLDLASLTPSGNPYVELYVETSVDGGSTYADSPGELVGVFPLDTATGAKARAIRHLAAPVDNHKWTLVNQSGVAFAGTGSTLRIRYYKHGTS